MNHASTLKAWRALPVMLLSFVAITVSAAVTEDTYLSVPGFLDQSFSGEPEAGVLWLDETQRSEAREISGEDPGFRKRYWHQGDTVAWVIDVIGRDHPITVGVLVGPDGVSGMQVLVYRESRGWEVKHDFFTRQFDGATLDGGKLDRSIDNITGATLSVRAMKRAARLALWGYAQVMAQ